MLTSILDAKITTDVVRLGSRTTDERIAQYSLHTLEQLSGRGDLTRPVNREYAALKTVEGDITRIMNKIQLPRLSWEDAERFLGIHYPRHADSLRDPPIWIAELFRLAQKDENENGVWTKVTSGRGKKATQDLEITGIYGFWKSGTDLEFIRPPLGRRHKRTRDPRRAFLEGLGLSGRIPPFPSGSRPLGRLVESGGNVWSMSLTERECLAQSWEDNMRKIAYESNLEEFKSLKERYKGACKDYEDVQDEVSQLQIYAGDY